VHVITSAQELSPVTKALATKAARRLDAGLTTTCGDGARIAGPRAARLLAELVVGAALIDALSPAAITASPIALSSTAVEHEGLVDAGAGWPAPSPGLLEVLAGVPTVERDDPWPLSDVAGAALAWACVHRFGARGVSSSSRQGIGCASIDVPGRAIVARALLGPPTPVPTRAGERKLATLVDVGATLRAPTAPDRRALDDELTTLGARDTSIVVDSGGTVRLRAVVSSERVEALVLALWKRGAADVSTHWVELCSAGVEEVTVPVGRGRTRSNVRVRVLRDGDDVVRVEPLVDDPRVAAEAIAAWERLGSHSGGERAEDGDDEDA